MVMFRWVGGCFIDPLAEKSWTGKTTDSGAVYWVGKGLFWVCKNNELSSLRTSIMSSIIFLSLYLYMNVPGLDGEGD